MISPQGAQLFVQGSLLFVHGNPVTFPKYLCNLFPNTYDVFSVASNLSPGSFVMYSKSQDSLVI